MNHLQQVIRRIRQQILIFVLLENFILIGAWWTLTTYTSLPDTIIAIGSLVIALGLTIVLTFSLSSFVIEPMEAIWQAIVHLSPTEHGIAAPKLEKLRLG